MWEGVRNYQARNFMTKEMKVGDWVLFYHSNAEPPGIAGIAKVSAAAKPDPTARKKNSPYFDPKATAENPIWECVTVSFVEKFPHLISLETLRAQKSLASMQVLKKGQRLSIQPVTPEEFKAIQRLVSKT